MLNIGSLILGFCAWGFAGVPIIMKKSSASYRNSVASFSFCLIALVLQLFEINRRVLLGDYAAIEDTIRAVLIASIVLIAVTVSLNLAAFLKNTRK